jgi:hypothetical protein
MVRPALDEAQITGERLSLEEAIRKGKGETARVAKARSQTVKIASVRPPRFSLRENPAPPESAYPDPLAELAQLIGDKGRSSRN